MHNLKNLLLPFILSLNLFANEQIPKAQGNSLKLKTKDTILSVGGRIQLDSALSTPDSAHSAKTIPIGEIVGEDGQSNFSSKNSRLWIKTKTPSEYGVVRALIETDFKGLQGSEAKSNGHGIRLRHAYFQVANWSVGQTNSAFNADTTLDILLTAINDTLVRQPLVRYQAEADSLSYTFSFEQPETTLIDPYGVIIFPKDDVIPDIVSRIIYYPKWGQVALSVMGRYINQDQAKLSNSAYLNNKDSSYGYGANFSGKLHLFSLDDIRFAAHYGKGLGRYLAYDAYPAGSIDINGEITLHKSFGGNIGYRHFWNPNLRTTIAYSYAGTDNNSDSMSNLKNVNKDVRSSQINLLWTPIKNSLVGIEYALAKRKVESSEEGETKIINMMIRYDF